MIKIHPQLLLIAELVLLYVVGGIISCKSPFKSFLEEISNCHLYFYYSPFLIFVFLLPLIRIWTMIPGWE